MPRRKSDPLDDMLQYFNHEPLVIVKLVRGLIDKIVDRRIAEGMPTPVKVQRRKRQPKPEQAHISEMRTFGTPEQLDVAIAPPAPATAPKPRRRRMRASSPPPPNEATPIVPLQDEVGDETYTGN